MQLTDKLMKPIKETTYLTAENFRRYRVILRFFNGSMSIVGVGFVRIPPYY